MKRTTNTPRQQFPNRYRNFTQMATGALFCTALLAATNATAISLDWVRQTAAALDGSCSVATDNSGNVYTTGSFSGTMDFDPGPGTANLSSAGSADVFITKTDGSGNLVWAKSIGGTDTDNPRTISIDGAGNVYVCGSFTSSSMDADPGAGVSTLSLAGTQDAFVVKLNAAGDFVWGRQFGGSAAEVTAHTVAADASGNVYVGGNFSATADFDPGSAAHTMTCAAKFYEAYITKLDASGNFVWSRQLAGDDFNTVGFLSAKLPGYIYAYGVFETTIDCDPGSGVASLTSKGAADLFVLKLDASGNFVWHAQAGGTEPDWPRGMDIDATGNVFVTGTFDGNADFDPAGSGYILTSVGATSNPDVFTLKLNSNGTFGWVKQFGSGFPDNGGGVAVDPSGNIYTTGSFINMLDADPGLSATYLTSKSEDVFISKLDPSGNYLWAGSTACQRSISYCRSISIAVDASENIYTVGYINDTVDMDPDAGIHLIASKEGSYFIQKLTNSITGNIPEFATEGITISPNPSPGLIRIVTTQNMNNGSLRITDMTGKTLLQQNGIYGAVHEVNCGRFPSGIYLLELSDHNHIYRSRISRK